MVKKIHVIFSNVYHQLKEEKDNVLILRTYFIWSCSKLRIKLPYNQLHTF